MTAPATAVFRVTHYGECDAQAVVNTTHWRAFESGGGTITNIEIIELAAAIAHAYRTNFRDYFQTTYTYRHTLMQVIPRVEISGVDADGNPIYTPVVTQDHIDDAGADLEGLAIGDPLPNTVAALVNLRTLRAGRRGKGRMKLLAGVESFSEGNRMTTTHQTNLQAAVDSYTLAKTLISTSRQFQMTVFSMTDYANHESPLEQHPWGFAYPLVDKPVNRIWGTQRSRKFRVLVG